MDGALQAIIAFKLQSNDQSISLPFGVKKLIAYKKTEKVTWVYIKEFKKDQGNAYDLSLMNEQGEVCIAIQGYQTRRVREAVKNEKNSERLVNKEKQDNTYCLVPAWELASSTVNIAYSPDICFVFGKDRTLEDSLKNQCSRVILVNELLEIDDFREFIRVSEIQHISCIVPYDREIESGIVAIQVLIDNNYRLIKAILAEEYAGKKLSWSICTERAFLTTQQDNIKAAPSALHGIFGVIQKEYQNWNIHLCDFDFLDKNLKNIELPLSKQGITWAYRDKKWYKQRLIKASQDFQLEIPDNSKSKSNVYVILGGSRKYWSQVFKIFTQYTSSQYSLDWSQKYKECIF